MNPKILVANTSRQHTHQLLYALQDNDYLQEFVFPLWFKPTKFPYKNLSLLPVKLRQKIEDLLLKRFSPYIDENLVKQNPWMELLRFGLGNFVNNYYKNILYFWVQCQHDNYVTKRIKKRCPDIFIGYEISSVASFKEARKKGAMTILDLANVHYKFCCPLESKYEPENYDPDFVGRVNKRKQQELDCVDYIFCISSLARDSLINNGIDEKKVITTYLGFDSSIFTPKKKYPLKGAFRILFVGSLIKRKGIHILLEAFRQAKFPNAKLTLIGANPGNDNTILKKYKDFYEHIPYTSQKQLVQHYKNADVFVLPSFLDSWGMVVPEAMSCGTPVIITENIGSKDMVGEDCGFVIPIERVDILKKALEYCYHNRHELEKMGKRCHERIKEYTWQKYHNRIATVINELWRTKNG